MLEKNKIYLGDCLEVMKDIPDGSVDCIITDPPYGITACEWDVKINLDAMWKEFKRVMTDTANIVIFSNISFAIELINSNKKMFRYELIWNKGTINNFVNKNVTPLKCHEIILIMGKKAGIYNPQIWVATSRIEKSKKIRRNNINATSTNSSIENKEGKRFPLSIITFNAQEKECNNICRLHSTQKPLNLIKYLIKTYTNEGMLVLDPFSGSGTTAIAARELKRDFIAIEKDKEYYNISLSRFDRHFQQEELLK